jgi:hypothetical protein
MGHHFSSELIKDKPELNLSDLYVFQSARPDHTTFVMCTNPQSKAGSAEGLHQAGLYTFHIAAGRQLLTGCAYTFQRHGGQVRVGLSPHPVPELGDSGSEIGRVPYYTTSTLANGVKVWIGVVKDPFAGNPKGMHLFLEAAAKGEFNPEAFDNRESPFENMLTTAIVFEVPNDQLPPTVHYSGSSAWFDHGHWHRVNRIGHVLVPHLYLQEAEHRQAHDGSSHSTDHQRIEIAVDIIKRHAKLAGVQADPEHYAREMANRLLPDVVPYRVGTPAAYVVDSPNGRALTDPAMDTALHWLVGAPLSAQTPPHDRATAAFPYLVLP